MATNHTTNYALNLWEPTDAFLREEFNENFQKLDEATPHIATGTYQGNNEGERFLDLGFTPKAVYICTNYGCAYDSSGSNSFYLGGLIVAGGPLTGSGHIYGRIVEGGFKVYRISDGARTFATNQLTITYHYLAIG